MQIVAVEEEDTMVRMFVRHRVDDYTGWKAVYDGFDAQRRELGVTGHAAYQAVGDPNDVTVWHEFGSQDAAESFAASPELREVMQRAGVQGQPDVWFTTLV
jgi:hypothetical protein